MSVQLTPVGQQAYQILQWAFEDPAGRASQARERLSALTGATDQEHREIGDAATMLSRLASSLPPAGRTISDQIGGSRP